MLFLDTDCATLEPIIKLLKFGVVPLIQAAIIVVLIVLLILDLGKAVMAGKEDEIKSAQKLAIKRVVYALVVFLVPWIVNVAIGVLSSAKSTTASTDVEKEIERADTDANTAFDCWAKTTKNGYNPNN